LPKNGTAERSEAKTISDKRKWRQILLGKIGWMMIAPTRKELELVISSKSHSSMVMQTLPRKICEH